MNRKCGTCRLSRRRFLGGASLAVATAVAGCGSAIDWLADLALEDVNILNEADRRVAGTVEIVDPNGETVLSASFDLPPEGGDDSAGTNTTDDDSTPSNTTDGDSSDASDSEANLTAYPDVWTTAGSYEVRLELSEPLDGEREHVETVAVEEPDEEMLLVGLDVDDLDDPITFRVGESLSDLVGE